MIDNENRNKVIEGLEFVLIESGWDANRAYGEELMIEAVTNAIAMLKSQNPVEPIESRLHLCESCTKEYPECDATADGLAFGCGVGNDNVIGCTAYVNRWKAHEQGTLQDYEAEVEMQEYCERYEPTYNDKDGSM